MSGIALQNTPSNIQRKLDQNAMKQFWMNSQTLKIIFLIFAASLVGLIVLQSTTNNVRQTAQAILWTIFALTVLALLTVAGPFVQEVYEQIGSDKVLLGIRDRTCKGGSTGINMASNAFSSNATMVDKIGNLA